MFGGKKQMARNLVRDNEEKKETNLPPMPPFPPASKGAEKELQILTEQQFMIEGLGEIIRKLDELKEKLEFGFKEVGVDFSKK